MGCELKYDFQVFIESGRVFPPPFLQLLLGTSCGKTGLWVSGQTNKEPPF